MKMYEFRIKKYIEIYCWGSSWDKVIIGSGNGLSPVRRQAITYTNDDPIPYKIYDSPGLNDSMNELWLYPQISSSLSISLYR